MNEHMTISEHMTVSELIKVLSKIRAEHGDLEIIMISLEMKRR